LESIELRYTRGDSALETIVRTARGLRDDIDALGERLKNATSAQARPRHEARDPKAAAARQQAALAGIIADIKELIINIDDTIPLINLWVSAIGGIQAPSSSFSPSRLLQASMLVNVGDTQFILDPSQPMQIGPDFTLSLYMLFRGHASAHEAEEPYGVEEGQRKPMWQEVIHKARVRLLRVPLDDDMHLSNGNVSSSPRAHYAYQLQVVEDLDDGRLHAFENRDLQPASYDGLPLAGIREFIPIRQIAKMFYADVGKILNINNDDGASSSPVLLLKRDVNAMPIVHAPSNAVLTIENTGHNTVCESEDAPLEADSQDDIDSQLRQEMALVEEQGGSTIILPQTAQTSSGDKDWRIPQDLDPEWIALEVFDIDESDEDSDASSTLDEKDSTPDNEDISGLDHACRPRHTCRPSVDRNLITQMNRMSIASSRPSSSGSYAHLPTYTTSPGTNGRERPGTPSRVTKHTTSYLSPTKLIERSPFGAIKTSLSLLEMILRLTSLQEFEQTTHLAIPDHVLKFYLDESVSTSGLHGKERWAASAEAERKVGFDPYADPST
jgi:hypothetical protein